MIRAARSQIRLYAVKKPPPKPVNGRDQIVAPEPENVQRRGLSTCIGFADTFVGSPKTSFKQTKTLEF